MPRSVICLAAKGLVRDVETNTISVFGILEQLNPDALPAFIPEAGVFVLWRRVGNEGPSDVTFVCRNNQLELARQVIRVDFENQQACRSLIGLRGMPVHEAGSVSFEFRQDGVDQPLALYEIMITPPRARVESPPG